MIKMKSKYSEEAEKGARKRATDMFKGHYGKKAKVGLWVCGDLKLSSSKKTECSECGRICYYDQKLSYLSTKNNKKICLTCALENHSEELNQSEIGIIDNALKR